ncbi:MAG: MerR family transcriptional regulator [Lachnospiraceae bacterium]|nr:MerR family transcriptional regulator [Lachnospiraceae bacterium]
MNRTNQKHYLKIGEVAKLNRISTATLRYYDQIGLFSPAHTTESGYRYYSVDQLVDLELIIWMRNNGAPLKDIQEIISNKSLDKVVSILEAEMTALQDQIQLLKNRLKATHFYLSHYRACCELTLEECRIMEFDNRYAICSKRGIDCGDRTAYQIALNKIRCSTDTETFLNSYIGGVFHRSKKGDGFSQTFFPASVNIYDNNAPDSIKIPAGFFAVMLISGFFDTAYQYIPELISYLQQMGYQINGNCYVWKIWESVPEKKPEGELLEIQIPLKRLP